MSYVFYPEREPADPDGVADKFSEALAFTEGNWLAWFPANLILDSYNVVSRLHSIKIESPRGAAAESVIGYLKFYNPIDMSTWEALRFRLAAQNYSIFEPGNPNALPNLSGDFRLWLKDQNGIRASIAFGIQVNSVFQAKELRMDSPEWWVEQGFDWTRVVEWVWEAATINMNPFTWPGGCFWIDVGPFMYKWEVIPPPPKTWVRLRVSGAISAQAVIFHGEYSDTVTVPKDFTVSPAGDWGFRALGEGFLYWLVNDVRYDAKEITVTLAEGSDTTLTMVFEIVVVPPSGSDVLVALGVLATIITIGGVIYLSSPYFRGLV